MEQNTKEQGWHFYAMAVVAENKPRTTNKIFATPMELANFSQGDLKADQTDLEAKGVDAKGKEYRIKVRAVSAQEYDWLPEGNIVTAPDVRRGEQVFIYRYADTDKFYWVSTQLNRNLRRLETTTFMWQADPNAKNDDPWTDENCYVLEVSTHDGLVTFTTSQKNNEPFKYTFQLNTKEGFFSIQDQDVNVIQMNSAEQIIHLQNKNGTYWVLDKDDLKGYAPNNIDIEAVKNIDFRCTNYTLKATESIKFETKVWTVNASESITFDTQTFNWNAQTTNIDSPTINIKGNINHTGNQTTSGTMMVGGATTLSGGMSVAGSMTNDGKDVGKNHTHIGSPTAATGPKSPTGGVL